MNFSSAMGSIPSWFGLAEKSSPEPNRDEPDDGLVTYIKPPSGWELVNSGELWQHRELLYFLVWRDVKVRYKQTVLGIAWGVLQPLMMMLVFTLFFGRMAGFATSQVPYPLFAFAGVLPWIFFSTALTSASNSVIGSERLISKVYFPRLLIPFAAVGAAAVDFLVAFGLLLVMMLMYQVWPTWHLLLAPVAFLFIVIASLGFGSALAALNVRYRDFRHVIPFFVQFWMFATPTVYMQPKVGYGGIIDWALRLNPLTSLIGAFRAACLGTPMDWTGFLLSAAVVVLVFVAGCFIYRRAESLFADLI
jgi:lipopolysaccharide transport system permease protein